MPLCGGTSSCRKMFMATEIEEKDLQEEEEEVMVRMGAYRGMVRLLGGESEESAAGETMLLWGIQQPTLTKPNVFVSHSSLQLRLDACGSSLSIFQSPSSMSTPGVTGAVMWDSGVILGKFLEHAVDAGMLLFQEKKVIELGSGCGLVGCIAALLGGQVILTDLPDRLKLLRKNVEANLGHENLRGSATVRELVWSDDPDLELLQPSVDYVLGSDVIYSEEAVVDLVATLMWLCGTETTIILAGELRNDAVLEYFLGVAMKEFSIGRVDQIQWHPDYRSSRVVLYIMVKKPKE